MLTSPKLPLDYKPSVEDLLHVQEFFEEERQVAAKIKKEREISETDTRVERLPRERKRGQS